MRRDGVLTARRPPGMGRVLVTGAAGQLGQALCRELTVRDISHTGATRQDFDLTDEQAVRRAVFQYRPDAVVHCAAYTKVDQAEDDPEGCLSVNAAATETLSAACREAGALLVYLSTDYVFDGSKQGAYAEEDVTAPLNVYGRTKLLGEQAVRRLAERHLIVRTSWIFGGAGGFVGAILRLAQTNEEIRVVSDQTACPTYAPDLAHGLCDLLCAGLLGTYHITNSGTCSRAQLAAEAIRQSGLKCRVRPVSSEEYGAKALRPRNSCLSGAKLAAAGFPPLPSWQDALRRCLKEMNTLDLGRSNG